MRMVIYIMYREKLWTQLKTRSWNVNELLILLSSRKACMYIAVCSRLFVCLTLSFPMYLDQVLKDERDYTQRLPVGV